MLAHQVVWEDRTLVVLHNLADQPVTAAFRLPSGQGPVELCRAAGHPDGDRPTEGGRLKVPLPRVREPLAAARSAEITLRDQTLLS